MLLSVTSKQDENPNETNYANYVGTIRIQMGLLGNNIVERIKQTGIYDILVTPIKVVRKYSNFAVVYLPSVLKVELSNQYIYSRGWVVQAGFYYYYDTSYVTRPSHCPVEWRLASWGYY